MRKWLWLGVAVVAGCGGGTNKRNTTPTSTSASPEEVRELGLEDDGFARRDSADEVHAIIGKSPDRPTLMRWIAMGAPGLDDDPCLAAYLWGPVDAEVAGEKLDRAVRAKASGHEMRARLCHWSAATARLLRKARMKKLDLHTDLTSTFAGVRAVAATWAGITGQVRELPALRALESDPDDAVQRESCRARWTLGDAKACGGKPKPGGDAFATISGSGDDLTPAERCQDANDAVEKDDRPRLPEALFHLLAESFSRFDWRFDPLDFVDSEPPTYTCKLTPTARDRILTTPDTPAPVRAMIAAILLWDQHPALSSD